VSAVCEVHRLGCVDYRRAWELQNELAGEIGAGQRPATLLLLEHPHTYTFGRRGRIENLLWDEAELSRRGISVHWVDRGGDVTYHGPGQLVGYPLLPLGRLEPVGDRANGSARLPQADYVGYVRRLEETLILALARLGVPARQVEGLTGVWVDQQLKVEGSRISYLEPPTLSKIAAIGVKVDGRGVSRHGFALNGSPDMSFWQGIIACGLVDHAVTCLAEHLEPVPLMDCVTGEVASAFGQIFDYDLKFV